MTLLSPPAPDTTLVPTPDVAALVAPTPSSEDISVCMRYKSLLDRFIRMESLPEATYETVNEGSLNLPRFRSTVLVGEEQFISPNVFLRKKKAEDDAAKIALESLCKEIDEENFSLIHQGSGFCKALLTEYADRMKLEKPVYNTLITVGHCIPFASSLVFNGLTYVGRNAGTKKEAKILAAQAVLLDLIGAGDSMSRKILFIIIKSNAKHYAQQPNNHDFEKAGRSAASMSNENKPTKAISQDVPTRDSAQEGIKPVSEAVLKEMKPPSGGVSTSVKQFTSPDVAFHKKEVEYDVVKTAVESLSKMLKEKGTVSFRSVLSDYANKRRLKQAVYNTVEAPGYFPLFVSSAVFNGLTYVGKTAKTRKEAEKLAAEAVILALIGGDDSTARTIIYEIINAKMRHLATLREIDSQNVESRTALMGNDSVPIIPTSQAEVEAIQERNELPIASVPTIAGTSSVEGPSSKKRKRIRNKAAKKLQPEAVQQETKAPIDIVMTPVEQTPAVPHLESSVPEGEGTQETIENPAAVVRPSVSSSADVVPVSMKRKRIRSRAAKKMRAEVVQEETKTAVATAMTPVEQTPAVPHLESSVPKGEGTQERIENLAAVVPPNISSSADAGSVSMKRKRIRSKAAKKMRAQVVQEETKTPIADVMTSVEQTPAVPHHECSVPKGEGIQEGIQNPVATVPPNAGPPSDEGGPSSRKRKRIRVRAPKKMQAEAIQEGTKTPISVVPHHEFSVPKGEALQEVIENAVAVVPPSVGSSADAGSTGICEKE